MGSGWILLHRQLKEHWIWKSERRLKWWLDILLTVNHTEAKVMIGNKIIVTTRGQCIRSLETWAKEWGVTKKTIRDFFLLLQNDGMITVESLQITTRITVCNYDSYQRLVNGQETTAKRTGNGQETETTPKQIIIKEEIKNIVDYLNLKAGKNFKHSTKKTKELIESKLNDGYSVDNFKTVIERKSEQWLNTEQDKYLRPETLFGNKFEGYLNEKQQTKSLNGKAKEVQTQRIVEHIGIR